MITTSETNVLSPVKTLSLVNFLTTIFQRGDSFALWRKPNESQTNLVICKELHPLDEPELHDLPAGFIVAPFLSEKTKYFLKADWYFKVGPQNEITDGQSQPPYIFENDVKATFKLPHRSTSKVLESKHPYEEIVSKALKEIANGSFEKVVPSRYLDIQLPESFDLLTTFHRLCSNYPNALVSLFSSPETGLWMGASPELLVSVDSNLIFRTVALAGTLPYKEGMNLKSVAWTEKEIEEQALVSRYIINCFKKIRLREYEEHGPRTAIAGNLLHLKTEYAVDMNAVNFPTLGTVMLKLLHPTSAVCGMPLSNALEFLKNHEGYDREFYSGYLGPVNIQDETSIFVNLRCMKISESTARLFAGAGITIDSQPSIEMAETEMKMKTLLNIIA